MPYKDRERQREYQAAWHQANKEHHRAKCRRWKKENAAKVREIAKAWRAKNREEINRKKREWRKEHSLAEINRRHDERMRRPFPVTTY